MYIQRSLTLFFTLKICFSIAQPITSWLPINPNKTFQPSFRRLSSQTNKHKRHALWRGICQFITYSKISEPGQRNMLSSNTVVVASLEKTSTKKKKLNRTPGERENLAPVRLLWSKIQKGWQNWHLLITHRENTAIKSDAFKGFLELVIKCVVYASRIQMKRISS